MARRRSKGAGSIFKRGKYYYLQVRTDGKAKLISLKTANKAEAEEKAKTLEPAMVAKTREEVALHVAQARKLISSDSIMIDEAWERYLRNPKRHGTCKQTEGNHKTRYEKFREWLSKNHPGVETMAQVSEGIVSEYAADLWEGGMSAKTFNDHIAALRLVFKALEREAALSMNPFRNSNIEKKDEEHQTRRELSETELLAVLAAPDSLEIKILNKEEMKVLLNLGAWAGLRLKDAALLKWADVNFEMGQMSVIPSKTRRHRVAVIIPLHPNLESELLRAQGWKSDSGYVLPDVAERYLRNPAGIVKDIGRLFRKAGIETTLKADENSRRKLKISIAGFHSLRHSFVSFCAKKGVPLAVVQSLVGHGNPAMTRHYTHLGVDSARQAIAALPMLSTPSADASSIPPEEKKRESLIQAISGALTKTDLKTLSKIANQLKLE